ncbi:DNA helicase [Pycnococcus provasolii]
MLANAHGTRTTYTLRHTTRRNKTSTNATTHEQTSAQTNYAPRQSAPFQRISGVLSGAVVIGSVLVGGNVDAANAATVFDGKWVDTNHPGCRREIQNGVLYGDDPVPFVPAAGDGKPGSPCIAGGETKPWSVKLTQIDEKKGTVLIDFDQKDGSGERFVAQLVDGGKKLRINDTTTWPRASP